MIHPTLWFDQRLYGKDWCEVERDSTVLQSSAALSKKALDEFRLPHRIISSQLLHQSFVHQVYRFTPSVLALLG
jgi:hypothetical protein